MDAAPGRAQDDTAVHPSAVPPPTRLVCVGVKTLRTDYAVSSANITFEVAIDPLSRTVKFDGELASRPVFSEDEVSFLPPWNKVARAYVAVLTLGMSEKASRIVIQRKTGTFHSGRSSGICRVSDQSSNLF